MQSGCSNLIAFILLSEHRRALLFIGTCPLLPPKAPLGRVCQLCPGFGSGSSSWALVWGDGGGGLVYTGRRVRKPLDCRNEGDEGELFGKKGNRNSCQLILHEPSMYPWKLRVWPQPAPHAITAPLPPTHMALLPGNYLYFFFFLIIAMSCDLAPGHLCSHLLVKICAL